jgi:hypothetical protein
MTNQGFALARRFSAAADPAKLELLLQKVRKSEGKITTLSWGNLGDIFSVLDPGWKLEKSVSIVKLYGRFSHSPADKPEVYYGSKVEAEKKHQSLQKDAVTSLPSSPKANQLYVLDLTEVVPSEHLRSEMFEFSCRPWAGVESWTITTSNGKTIVATPDAYQIGELQHGYKKTTRGKIPSYAWVPQLNKETDWLSQIDKKLGLGVFEKSVPRTREKTGSCPVCFSNVKIGADDQKIVLHGYQRPGTGTLRGSCSGVGYKAFEVDVKGTKDYLKQVVSPQALSLRDYAKRLGDGRVTSLTLWNGEVVKVGDGLWDYHYKRELEKAEDSADTAEKLEEAYTKIVQHWEVRPLPKEGERHIDWFYKGRGE